MSCIDGYSGLTISSSMNAALDLTQVIARPGIYEHPCRSWKANTKLCSCASKAWNSLPSTSVFATNAEEEISLISKRDMVWWHIWSGGTGRLNEVSFMLSTTAFTVAAFSALQPMVPNACYICQYIQLLQALSELQRRRRRLSG